MKLINPNGNPKKAHTLSTIRILLILALVAGALTETFILLFPYIKEMILTNHTSTSDLPIGWMFLSYVIYIVLGVIIWLAIDKALTKCYAEVEINLSDNIAVCDCGHKYNFNKLNWKVTGTHTKSTTNDDLTRIITDTIGNIVVSIKCSKCGKEKTGYICDITLNSDIIVTKHDIWNDKNVTTSSSEKTTNDKIISLIRDRFNSDKSEYERTLNAYTKLGYRSEDDIKKKSSDSDLTKGN